MGSVTLAKDKLCWGDELHSDTKSVLYIYNLKTKKIQKDLEAEVHVERAPLYSDGLKILPLGPAGIMAISSSDLKNKWMTKVFEGKKLHIDSNLLILGEKVCATSVYELKSVICFAIKTGKETQSAQ